MYIRSVSVIFILLLNSPVLSLRFYFGHNNYAGPNVKTRAELEEIALAEADVARLKQKVAELHHQLNQQRQHQFGSLSDACDRYESISLFLFHGLLIVPALSMCSAKIAKLSLQ